MTGALDRVILKWRNDAYFRCLQMRFPGSDFSVFVALSVIDTRPRTFDFYLCLQDCVSAWLHHTRPEIGTWKRSRSADCGPGTETFARVHQPRCECDKAASRRAATIGLVQEYPKDDDWSSIFDGKMSKCSISMHAAQGRIGNDLFAGF